VTARGSKTGRRSIPFRPSTNPSSFPHNGKGTARPLPIPFLLIFRQPHVRHPVRLPPEDRNILNLPFEATEGLQ
jgi:hypothetical protein